MRKLCLIVICVVFCSTSVFSREYKSLDKWAYKTPVSAEKSIETLAEYLKKALFHNNALDTYTLKSCLYAVCAE